MSEKKKHPEYEILANLLELAAEFIGVHGCNDYELPNTPENRAFIEGAEAWNVSESGDTPIELNISPDGKTIYTRDDFLCSYFSYLFSEMAKEQP